jgi:perosamine synthetase
MSDLPKTTVPIAGPWVTDLEVAYVASAARHAWYEGAGTWVRRFESSFAAAVGRGHAVALPSCTAGLHLALAGAGIGPGDEVVVPDATWIASAAPVSYVGATVVFADIDERTWCLTPESVAAVLTPRTRAVIAVDLYGSMPDLDALSALCADRGLVLIEDAAEGLGSTFGGRPAGSFGAASVFSFHGSKTLTTGEGGMLVTDDDELLRTVEVLRDHGRRPGDTTFSNHQVAFKYKMSELQAAFGVAQLERLDELVARKREIFAWYRSRLEGIPGLSLNAEPDSATNSFWMVTAVLDPDLGLAKEIVRDRLADVGIDTRPFFHPLSSLEAYRGAPGADAAARRNQVSYRICPYGVNLPSALRLDEADVDRVCSALRSLLGHP